MAASAVMRTVRREQGHYGMAETIAKFQKHFAASGERQRKHVEHWKKRLVELLESRLLERALGGAAERSGWRTLAAEVAERKKDRLPP